MNQIDNPSAPLTGIQVLDFTNMLSGPYCTRLLADLGARVIKVESPHGDHNRTRRPVRDGHSSFFGHLNCGKQSVVMDLKSPAGREAATALAARVDVVVENWRPGVADRLGIGYTSVGASNPRVVYCSISGFGQKGPNAQRPAYAPIIHAASGYDLAQVRYQGGGRPANTATFTADVLGGMSAFAAIQSALFHRERCGRGQYIDVAMVDAMLNVLISECQEAQAPSGDRVRVYRPLKTRDGFVVVAPTSQKNFEQLTMVLKRPEWLKDPRLVTSAVREKNWTEFMDLIEGWTSERSSIDVEVQLLAGGVPCTRYLTVEEALAEPQLRERGTMTRITDPAGSYLVPGLPFVMPGLFTAPRPGVPGLGEHSAAVLGEMLGYSAAQARNCSGAADH